MSDSRKHYAHYHCQPIVAVAAYQKQEQRLLLLSREGQVLQAEEAEGVGPGCGEYRIGKHDSQYIYRSLSSRGNNGGKPACLCLTKELHPMEMMNKPRPSPLPW